MGPPTRRKTLPSPLHINPPPANPHITATQLDSSSSALSSASEDQESFFNPPSFMSRRKNTKKLSLALPSKSSSHNSFPAVSEPQSAIDGVQPDFPRPANRRRPSVLSLPAVGTTSSMLHRKDEDGGSPTAPYADGPIQIIPGIWLGSEDNARDWKVLIERGIRSILNVAKEVTSPFDSLSSQPLRSTASVPNLKSSYQSSESTYYPPHVPSGRPGMHYLKLQWSHGQQDLVNDGFQAAMAFTDAALVRGDGVLVHCQCGVSRSATLVIALVMRAAAERSASVPPEVWALKGMQGAYDFVKEKSKWIGPNMSLIYQLLDYEKKLKSETGSPGFSDKDSGVVSEEEEWTRQRQLLDEIPSDNERDHPLIMQEARALDKAMEDRIVARKSSTSSIASAGSGIGMGPAWRNKYSSRKRTGSIASNMTNNSKISENLVEEEEEPELLGVGGGFDSDRERRRSADTLESSTTSSPDNEMERLPRDFRNEPLTARPLPALRSLPSAPAWKSSFSIPPRPLPKTAVRTTFDLSSRPLKLKHRPPPIGLPPVPPSPVTIVVAESELPSSDMVSMSTPDPTSFPSQSLPDNVSVIQPPSQPPLRSASLPKPTVRQRTESRKLPPPPLHLRKVKAFEPSMLLSPTTPHQTLLVFPPSPTLTTRTPSAVMLTTADTGNTTTKAKSKVPFPSLSTPRVAMFRQHGRTKSFIGTPMTPTTAFTKVEAKGYVGIQ